MYEEEADGYNGLERIVISRVMIENYIMFFANSPRQVKSMIHTALLEAELPEAIHQGQVATDAAIPEQQRSVLFDQNFARTAQR